MALELYHYWRSSCSWRVRWALALKGLAYEPIAVNLLDASQKSEQYRALNPMGQVPCLVIDGHPFADSIAIMEYLDELHPTPALLPADGRARAHVRRLVNLVASGIQPIQNLGVMRHHSPEKAEQIAWNRHWITEGLKAYEAAIAPEAGAYSFGGSLTMADLCLVPQVYNAHRVKVEMSAFPKVAEIYDRCRALESCQAAAPETFEPKG